MMYTIYNPYNTYQVYRAYSFKISVTDQYKTPLRFENFPSMFGKTPLQHRHAPSADPRPRNQALASLC